MMLIRQVIHKNNLSRKGRDNLVTEIGILKKLKHKFIVDLRGSIFCADAGAKGSRVHILQNILPRDRQTDSR